MAEEEVDSYANDIEKCSPAGRLSTIPVLVPQISGSRLDVLTYKIQAWGCFGGRRPPSSTEGGRGGSGRVENHNMERKIFICLGKSSYDCGNGLEKRKIGINDCLSAFICIMRKSAPSGLMNNIPRTLWG